LFVILIGLGLLWADLSHFEPGPDAYASSDWQRTDPDYIKTQMSRVIPDYIHPQLSHIIFRDDYQIMPPSTRISAEGDDPAEISIAVDKPQHVVATIEASSDVLVTALIFDFPGWKWTVDDEPVNHRIGRDLPVMQFNVPTMSQKSFTIEGRLTKTPLRAVAEGISLGSLLLLAGIGFICKTSKK
jgi:hypothetical protein